MIIHGYYNNYTESTSVESYPATNPLDDDTCNAQVVTDDGGSSKHYRGIAPPGVWQGI